MHVYRVNRGEPWQVLPGPAGSGCAACGKPFKTDDWIAEVPIGCGADAGAREAAQHTEMFAAVTVLCHWPCITGYDVPKKAALAEELRHLAEIQTGHAGADVVGCMDYEILQAIGISRERIYKLGYAIGLSARALKDLAEQAGCII